jgi:hypothetical protein
MNKPFTPAKVRQYIWATYVHGRSPQFKVHSSEGLANSAIGYHYPQSTVVKYKLQDGEWQEFEAYEPPTNCDWCNGTFLTRGYVNREHISYHRPRYAPGPEFKKPVICFACHEKEYNEHREKARVEQEPKELERLKSLYEG